MSEPLLFNEKGLTLTELMIAMTLSLVLMAAVFLANQIQSQTSTEQQHVVALQQDLRATGDLLSRDIRNAGASIDQKIVPFSNFKEDSITIRTDLNVDGDTADPGELVTYSHSGSIITRKDENAAGAKAETLVDNATTFELTYLDKDMKDSTAADPLDAFEIAYVKFNIILTDSRLNLERTATRTVNVRNCYE